MVACRKETSIETAAGLSGSFRATIDGSDWISEISLEGASITPANISLHGLSIDQKQLTITLAGISTGVYKLDQQTASVAVFVEKDSADAFSYASNEGKDSTQAGGIVTVTEIDTAKKTITGSFSFTLFRNLDKAQKVVTNGVFYKISYDNGGGGIIGVPPITPPPGLPGGAPGGPNIPAGTDTLVAKLDGSTWWVGLNITASALSTQLFITGVAANGVQTVGLIMPVNTSPGTYPLDDHQGYTYIGFYSPSSTINLASASGTITILENNTTARRCRGNFQFPATDPSGMSAESHQLTNGYFSVKY
jgi:hypothetical protein